jgi:hypothetical protein
MAAAYAMAPKPACMDRAKVQHDGSKLDVP